MTGPDQQSQLATHETRVQSIPTRGRPPRFFGACKCGWQGWTRMSWQEADAEGDEHEAHPDRLSLGEVHPGRRARTAAATATTPSTTACTAT
jgi:hypothetical protein